jgi:hypothetical protein
MGSNEGTASHHLLQVAHYQQHKRNCSDGTVIAGRRVDLT